MKMSMTYIKTEFVISSISIVFLFSSLASATSKPVDSVDEAWSVAYSNSSFGKNGCEYEASGPSRCYHTVGYHDENVYRCRKSVKVVNVNIDGCKGNRPQDSDTVNFSLGFDYEGDRPSGDWKVEIIEKEKEVTTEIGNGPSSNQAKNKPENKDRFFDAEGEITADDLQDVIAEKEGNGQDQNIDELTNLHYKFSSNVFALGHALDKECKAEQSAKSYHAIKDAALTFSNNESQRHQNMCLINLKASTKS